MTLWAHSVKPLVVPAGSWKKPGNPARLFRFGVSHFEAPKKTSEIEAYTRHIPKRNKNITVIIRSFWRNPLHRDKDPRRSPTQHDSPWQWVSTPIFSVLNPGNLPSFGILSKPQPWSLSASTRLEGNADLQDLQDANWNSTTSGCQHPFCTCFMAKTLRKSHGFLQQGSKYGYCRLTKRREAPWWETSIASLRLRRSTVLLTSGEGPMSIGWIHVLENWKCLKQNDDSTSKK